MKKKYFFLSIFIVSFFSLMSQTNNRSAAINGLKQVAATYLADPFLSFDVSYYYARESSPQVYEDSLKGSFKMNGKRYWYIIDSTETLVDTSTIVILYKEDKIMYLTKTTAPAQGMNPVALVDSFISAAQSADYKFSETKDDKIISIFFGNKGIYKSMTCYVDKITGMLQKTIALVKAEQLYDPQIREQVINDDTYAVLETRFTHYQRYNIEKNWFDAARYFRKEGGAMLVMPAYADYKIFLGKPGLDSSIENDK